MRRVGNGCQGDDIDVAGEFRRNAACYLERQPGFANASRPCQRDESVTILGQPSRDRRELLCSPDDGRRGQWNPNALEHLPIGLARSRCCFSPKVPGTEEDGAALRVELKGIGEHTQGLEAWGHSHTTFQVADSAQAQPGEFGQAPCDKPAAMRWDRSRVANGDRSSAAMVVGLLLRNDSLLR